MSWGDLDNQVIDTLSGMVTIQDVIFRGSPFKEIKGEVTTLDTRRQNLTCLDWRRYYIICKLC